MPVCSENMHCWRYLSLPGPSAGPHPQKTLQALLNTHAPLRANKHIQDIETVSLLKDFSLSLWQRLSDVSLSSQTLYPNALLGKGPV